VNLSRLMLCRKSASGVCGVGGGLRAVLIWFHVPKSFTLGSRSATRDGLGSGGIVCDICASL